MTQPDHPQRPALPRFGPAAGTQQAAPGEPEPGMPFEEFIEHSATVEEHRFDIYGAAVPEAFRMLKLKDGWRWHWHPLWWTLVFGLLSALGIAGVLFLPALNAKQAWCAVGTLDTIRTWMFFLSLLCIMFAAPVYRPPEWTPQTDVETYRLRLPFRLKRRL